MNDEQLREEIFNLLASAQDSIAPEYHPNVLTHRILALITARVEEAKKEVEKRLRFNPDWTPDVKAILDEFNEARSHWQEETNTKVREVAEEIKGELENIWRIKSAPNDMPYIIIDYGKWQAFWDKYIKEEGE